MDYINNAMVEPGTYQDTEGRMVVVVDYITHKYNENAKLLEALVIEEIVVRPLLNNKEYIRETYPRSIFLKLFVKI